MRKPVAFTSPAALLLLLALLPTTAPSADATEFEGFIHFCSSGPPEAFSVTPGGTVHVRGATNTNVWATNNPYLDGTETNEAVTININRQGRGNVTLHATLEPFAFDGAWEITLILTISKDGVFGHGVGHETGELRSMVIKFATGPEVLVPNHRPVFPALQ